jgi:hypothetical protein
VLLNDYSQLALYACFRGDRDLDLEKTTKYTLSRLGVHLRQLHNISNPRAPKESKYWRNLVCASQVADELFLSNVVDVSVVFIDSHIVAVRDLGRIIQQVGVANNAIYCAPKLGKSCKIF